MLRNRNVDPIERICRALCQFHGHSENLKMDGRPMWESYREEAMMMLWALREGDWLPSGLVVTKETK